MKAVFDTNVLIAAFLTDGLCAKLLLRARRNEFSLILCPFILQEFQKFLQVKIKASNQEIEMAVNLLKEAAYEINQPSFFSGAPSDKSRRPPVITRPPASYTACLPRLEPGNSKSRGIERTCRDADDDNILKCALASESDYLVTGDDDLLTLHKYGKTKIIKPRQFESLFIDD